MDYIKIVMPLIIVLLFISSGCEHSVDGTPPETSEAIIYGKVDAIPPGNINNTYAVLVRYNPEGCNKTKGNALSGVAGVSKSGTYRTIIGAGVLRPSICLEALLVSYANEDVYPTTDNYDSLYAGPKRFKVQLRDEPPYDSVRVDFTYPDSLK